jgi:hypothetical protein
VRRLDAFVGLLAGANSTTQAGGLEKLKVYAKAPP